MKVINFDAQREFVTTEKIKGVEFHVALSPYFFPDHLECHYDPDHGCLVIDFKYLDEEAEQELERAHELVSLTVGKYSGKLLSVRVHVDRNDVDNVRMLVTDEVPKAIQEAGNRKPEMKDNFELAEDAIRQKGDEIAGALVGTN